MIGRLILGAGIVAALAMAQVAWTVHVASSAPPVDDPKSVAAYPDVAPAATADSSTPDRLPTYWRFPIFGVVHAADGAIVAGATVTVSLAPDGGQCGGPVATDADGKFAFECHDLRTAAWFNLSAGARGHGSWSTQEWTSRCPCSGMVVRLGGPGTAEPEPTHQLHDMDFNLGGQVLSAVDRRPIEGASVSLNGGYTRTDREGRYWLTRYDLHQHYDVDFAVAAPGYVGWKWTGVADQCNCASLLFRLSPRQHHVWVPSAVR